MPIDDALEKIEKGEEKGKKKEDAELKDDSDLFEAGRALLGDYLTNKYFALDIQTYPNLKYFMANLAPFVLSIEPVQQNAKNEKYLQSIQFIGKIEQKTWQDCIKNTKLAYLADTDLMKIQPKKDKIITDIDIVPGKIFPEYAVINSALCKMHKVPVDNSSYQIVMGMPPRYRPFMAAAVEQAIKNNSIMIEQYTPSRNPVNIKQKILSALPSLLDITSAAEKYKIQNLEKIMDAFNMTAGSYSIAWW